MKAKTSVIPKQAETMNQKEKEATKTAAFKTKLRSKLKNIESNGNSMPW